MRFLVFDDRSGAPVHVFLGSDPTGEDGFPGLRVFPVTLDRSPRPAGEDGTVVGGHFYFPDLYREFGSGRAAAEALFRPVGPSYVGPTWGDYVRDTSGPAPGGPAAARAVPPGRERDLLVED